MWQHRARYFVQVTYGLYPTDRLGPHINAPFIGLRALDQPVLNLLQQNRLSLAVAHKLKGCTNSDYLSRHFGKVQAWLRSATTGVGGARHNLDFRDPRTRRDSLQPACSRIQSSLYTFAV